MAKDLNVSFLLDFYAAALTEKQRSMIELYYNQDLSLGEITEHVGITRQGVRDSIKRGEATLFDLEDKLGLAAWYHEVQEGLSLIEEKVKDIEQINDRSTFSAEIGGDIKVIQMVLNQLDQISNTLGQKGLHSEEELEEDEFDLD